MIVRLPEYRFFNPVRSHLRIRVRNCPESERLFELTNALKGTDFNPQTSRALVFVSTRRGTENLAEELGQLLASERQQVGHFHAGMNADEREEAYRTFKSGEVTVLCATKAFGMGMDIPNIHFVCHFDAPSALEDYLQEVGRGGRDEQSLAEAGFSPDSPITCLLFANQDDFARLKDKMHKNQLAWTEISQIQDLIHKFIKRLRPLKPDKVNAVPLPMDLLARDSAFQSVRDRATRQRLGLFWLEQLGRIRLGNFLPAYLEFENRELKVATNLPGPVSRLVRATEAARDPVGKSATHFLVSTMRLFTECRVGDYPALFKLIAEAERAVGLRLYHHVGVHVTQKRQHEVEYLAQIGTSAPVISVAFSMVRGMFGAAAQEQSIIVDNAYMQQQAEAAVNEHLTVEKWVWEQNVEKRRKIVQSERQAFARVQRQRTIFRLIGSAPATFLKTSMQDREVICILRTRNRDWQQWVDAHEQLCYRLLEYVHHKSLRNEPCPLISMLIELAVPEHDMEYLERTLIFLRGLGYLHYSAPLVPMAIETFILGTAAIDHSDPQGKDHEVFRSFEENKRLKELRLAALETLSLQEAEEAQNRFIEGYFKCADSQAVFALIQDFLPPDHALLKGLQSQALDRMVHGARNEGDKAAVDGLSEEQMQVYMAPVNQSSIVIAGPGSGKTHTLLVRLARLVHAENISPASILVLAYNRAVVAELKHRLQDLFTRLGYRHLVKSLKVFTFHGLVKYCLPNLVEQIGIESGDGRETWIDVFNQTFAREPGRIHSRIGVLTQILVDEYQDITEARYRMLRNLAATDRVSVTAIGDPNQSIYGYERAAAAGSRAAEPFFQRFVVDFSANEYRMSGNFRSYEKVLRLAESLIGANTERLLTEPLRPVMAPDEGWSKYHNYVEIQPSSRGAVLDAVQQLLMEKTDRGSAYSDIGILCRTNEEVYRNLGILQDNFADKNISIRVQGEGVALVQVRELAAVLDRFKERDDQILVRNELEELGAELSNRSNWPKNWSHDHRLTLLALVSEFGVVAGENPTCGEFISFIADITRGDDGQVYKLRQLWNDETTGNPATTELVLSTIHKVKGLEFDAVILPASFAELPFGAASQSNSMDELLDEERRVYYVALTRARKRLLWLQWERETALKNGRKFRLPAEMQSRLGIGFRSGLEDIAISKNASCRFIRDEGGFSGEQGFVKYMENEVGPGDPLRLRKNRFGAWLVMHGEYAIALLSKGGSAKLAPSVGAYKGLRITNVLRYSHEQSLKYDREHRTNFTEHWAPLFVKKGYLYVADFAGYAVPE